jgi:predicted ATP-grasp superfamily ATP-dependent carboligase
LRFAKKFTDRPLLFPTCDHDLNFIARFFDELSQYYRIVAPPPAILQSTLNKAQLYQIAQELSIPIPRTEWINSSAELETVKSSLVFPAIVKPIYASQWRKNGVWEHVGRRKAVVVHNYEELCKFYTHLERVDPILHVQEFIPGLDRNLFVFGSYINSNSGVLRYFTGHKVLQYPAHSGTGVVVRGLPIPDIVEPSVRLLQRLRFSGVSEIEYKYDERSRRYVLIEINPRHWDQHALGIACGVNLSRAAYLDALGHAVPEETQRPQPVTWIAEDGYLLSLLSNLRKPAYPFSDYVRAVFSRKAFAVFDRKDMRPTASLVKEIMREVARHIGWRISILRTRLRRWLPSAGSDRNKND